MNLDRDLDLEGERRLLGLTERETERERDRDLPPLLGDLDLLGGVLFDQLHQYL